MREGGAEDHAHAPGNQMVRQRVRDVHAGRVVALRGTREEARCVYK